MNLAPEHTHAGFGGLPSQLPVRDLSQHKRTSCLKVWCGVLYIRYGVMRYGVILCAAHARSRYKQVSTQCVLRVGDIENGFIRQQPPHFDEGFPLLGAHRGADGTTLRHSQPTVLQLFARGERGRNGWWTDRRIMPQSTLTNLTNLNPPSKPACVRVTATAKAQARGYHRPSPLNVKPQILHRKP